MTAFRVLALHLAEEVGPGLPRDGVVDMWVRWQSRILFVLLPVFVLATDSKPLHRLHRLGHRRVELDVDPVHDVPNVASFLIELEDDARGIDLSSDPRTTPRPLLLGTIVVDLVHEIRDHFDTVAVADKVENRDLGLARRLAKPAAELLQVHGLGLGRAKEDDKLRVRNVDSLVEHVHRQQVLDATSTESFEIGIQLLTIKLAVIRPRLFEELGHTFCLLDVGAEDDALSLVAHDVISDVGVESLDENVVVQLTERDALPLQNTTIELADCITRRCTDRHQLIVDIGKVLPSDRLLERERDRRLSEEIADVLVVLPSRNLGRKYSMVGR